MSENEIENKELLSMINRIEKSIGELKKGQVNLESKQDQQILRLHDLTVSISGDDSKGMKGLARRVEDSEEENKRLVREGNRELANLRSDVAKVKNNMKWAASIIVFLSPFFVWLATLLKETILNK